MTSVSVNPNVLQGKYLFPFIAPPNGGKGTQTKILSQKYNLPVYDMGATLRHILRNEPDSELAKELKQYMDAGQLVPIGTIVKVFVRGFEEFAARHSQVKGYILDGFPRDLDQAKALVDLAKQWGAKLAKVVYLNVPEAVVRQRSAGRRVCPVDDQTYNVQNPQFQPQRKKLNPDGTVARDAQGNEIWLCDTHPDKELIIRSDDLKIDARIATFNQDTLPAVDFFRKSGELVEVDGNREPAKVTAELDRQIGPVLGLSTSAP